jgi:hypothetical protein
MQLTLYFSVLLTHLAAAAGAEPKDLLTPNEAATRLRRALQLARDANEPDWARRVEDAAQAVVDAFQRGDQPAGELLVRDAERLVGLDPGGRSMNGMPIAQVGRDARRKLDALEDDLAAAMKAEDAARVRALVAEAEKVLGDQAGLPNARNKGDKSDVPLPRPEHVAELFLKAMDADPRTFQALAAGKPVTHFLPRFYGEVAAGCCAIRPLVAEHHPKRLAELDHIVNGCCTAMLELQTREGFFRFPDLRGRHLRFGEMIAKVAKDRPDAVKDGWFVVPHPDGGSRFDAGVCGTALLRASALFRKDDWKRAGLNAAEWALARPCVPNFSYNASSVGLLAEAYRQTREARYLDAAIAKFQVGVAPGQVANGRWIDPHNARTAFHLIILQGLFELEAALPADRKADREAVASVTHKGIKSVLDEFDAVGITNTGHAVPVLLRYQLAHPGKDARVRRHLQQAAAVVVERCTRGGEVQAAVPLPSLAAVAGVPND